MPLGVDEALLDDQEIVGPPSDWAESSRGLRIVQVGSLTENKRPHVLLDALSSLSDEGVPVAAAMLGDGPLRQSLADSAQQRGLTVRFLGNVAPRNVPDWLRAADVLVLSSLAEGRPVVIMEAMACGVPVVATDIPGVRELVDDGSTGMLFSPHDVGSLARILGQLAADPATRSRLGLAARAKLTSEGLLASQVAADHLAVYRAAIEGRITARCGSNDG
jgi:glycosyltransferase involved in cell wall biosynthesis